MKEIFKKVSQIISENTYDELKTIKLEKPEYFNWVEEIFEGIHVAERPNKTALLWTNGEETIAYSFKTMSEKANQLLNFLRNKGVKQHDIVLAQMMLQPSSWHTILTTIKGGFELIPTATIMGSGDLAFRFEKTLPKVVIADVENAAKTDEAEKVSGKNIDIKIICDGKRNGWYSLEDIEKESTIASAAKTKSDDTLFMFFTSGTTGMPKIVCHTQFTHPVGHLTTSSWIGVTENDIHYNISQPGWGKFAWSSFFAPWNVGATIFTHHTYERFSANRTLSLIEKHKITTLCAPPTVLRLFIQEDLKSFDFSLRQCVAAGEPLNPEIIEEWKSGTGILIRDGFGQTESTCLVGNLPNENVKFGSMGKPMFMYDVVIADEDGNILADDEEGNICIRMDENTVNGIFKGYLFDKVKQAEVFKNGLYYTGDKAYRDADGYIWFIGRDDDVIKASDYRIGPFEVESVLLEHEAVLESAVVGSPHPIKGYEVKAFIILGENQVPSEALAKELFDYSRIHLAPYKIPRILEFVTELPKTISGKIRRVEIRAKEAENKAKKIKSDNEFFYVK
ncbi:branched-chain amino acid aminotransferase [Paenimyroides tangerinum]|uniref:Branched-chain amino acid aminotransferase n=1 Tax=Paenimyroides tangerinum TaxID=2488728 RepID=A0A3P3WDD5_9FLAO|nr:AMP-binding protein [Paenimyroides tangerinum]RRJ92664.1 branched-chain amino acid aminotransferase [Paenimyroides tangerinum]